MKQSTYRKSQNTQRSPRIAVCLAIIISLCLSPVLFGEVKKLDDTWVLRFEDDFQHDQLGDQWTTNDAIIKDGRMLLGLKGPACAKVARPFPSDVRIEFTAQAYEKRPPCDLSVTIAAERFRLMSWNYLLAFGGVNNTVNKLTGGRQLKAVRDENPERLIEPGRIYKIVAIKEGKRLSMIVDDKLLLEAQDQQVMGGPGFDAVGLVTWNGMYVDNVRVYERKVPHPDTPRYVIHLDGLILSLDEKGRMSGPSSLSPEVKEAVAAYNHGDMQTAEKLFKSLDGEIKAAGLAYVYGNLNHDEAPKDFPFVAHLFSDISKSKPTDQRLANYAWAASLFGEIRLFPRSDQQCSLIMSLDPENNPFYDKAMLYRARFLRANGQEGGKREVLATAQKMFKQLKAKAPQNAVLRQLTGESIPWGQELTGQYHDAPRWASLLNEMYLRQLAIMRWWFSEKQLPDGQLGGGWGDDVEILRSWGPFAMISDAEPAVRDGIERLCQGVWEYVLEDGFDPGLGDVEHSSEPSADSIPTMLAIRFGDPLWYQRNLASCRRIRDYYTGIDKSGFIRFKSGHFGGKKASPHLQHGGDNFYCSRPMKHFLWPAWYGNNDAQDFYLSWVRGWVQATMTAKYTKPAGVPPSSIWYPSGDIAPSNGAPWNDPIYNIYGNPSVGCFRTQDIFLAGYALSRQAFFLQPLHAWMRLYETEIPTNSPANPNVDDDPTAWSIRNSRDTWKSAEIFAQYRWLTGDCSYDELFGKQYLPQRLHMPGTFEDFVNRIESTVKRLRVNFDLYTREVLQTDRASLPGSDFAFSAYTGAVREWGDAGVPTMAVTWHITDPNFAAIVPYTGLDHLRVWIYNFADHTTRMGMQLWQLEPGKYELRTGTFDDGKDYTRKYKWSTSKTLIVRHKADICWIDVPSKQQFAVDFRLTEKLNRPNVLPDPAIMPRDITVSKNQSGKLTIKATVHNLGNVQAENLTVALMKKNQDNFLLVAQNSINLPASKNFKSSLVNIEFTNIDTNPHLTIVLDPNERIDEIYELNNHAKVPGL